VGIEGGGLEPVALERDAARVGVEAVDLDREAEVPPDEVNLVAVDPGIRLIAGDPVAAEQR
jgi:hypothetical protein